MFDEYYVPIVLNSMNTQNHCTQLKYLSTPLYSPEVLEAVFFDVMCTRQYNISLLSRRENTDAQGALTDNMGWTQQDSKSTCLKTKR
jgi:hypothetical protein